MGRRRVKLRWMAGRKRGRRAANSACVERKRRMSEDMEVQSMGVMEGISKELEHRRGVKSQKEYGG